MPLCSNISLGTDDSSLKDAYSMARFAVFPKDTGKDFKRLKSRFRFAKDGINAPICSGRCVKGPWLICNFFIAVIDSMDLGNDVIL